MNLVDDVQLPEDFRWIREREVPPELLPEDHLNFITGCSCAGTVCVRVHVCACVRVRVCVCVCAKHNVRAVIATSNGDALCRWALPGEQGLSVRQGA